MAGQKVHTKFPARVTKSSPVNNARKVLRSRDPMVARQSVIHALRTLYRHRELDFDNEDDVKLIRGKLHVDAFEDAKTIITLDNPVR